MQTLILNFFIAVVLTVQLGGPAKTAQLDKEGIYIPQPDDVNGKKHWLQQYCSKNALWYDKVNYKWLIGAIGSLGSSSAGIISYAGVSSMTPDEVTTWYYHDGSVYIEATDEIIVSTGIQNHFD